MSYAMKKILVLSDSHGNLAALRNVIDAEPGTTDVIFLGDGLMDIRELQEDYPHLEIQAVRGNCDYSRTQPAESMITVENQLIFFCHGDGYQVKFTVAGLKYAARQRGADIALFGHTHSPYYEYTDELYVFNPGSVSRPRVGRPTYGMMILGEGVPRFYHKEVPEYW